MALSLCNTQTNLHDQEIIKHGNAAFPIACYCDELSTKDVPWHWHDELEFALVAEGTPEFYIENQHLPLPKGTGIFFNARALHAVKNTRGDSGILHSSVFHPRLVGGNTDSVFWQSLVQPLLMNSSTRFLLLHPEIPWEAQAMRHFEAAWTAVAEETDDFENVVRYELSAGLRLLIKHTDFTASSLSEQELLNAARIRTMLEYIESHYNDDLSVELLSEQISVSPSACLRCFHQMLDTTPMQYVKQLRIKKAAEKLLTTNQSAKEIALSCGFNDVSYFTKAFREIYQMTPGEYRKNQ